MTHELIHLDGAAGGGQILRSALTLSLATGKGFAIDNIRGARPLPGLKRQHLACVKAAAAFCGAETTGAVMGSRSLTFIPGKVTLTDAHFDIGTGGSTLLLAQALTAALARRAVKGTDVTLRLTGGTYCPKAPTYEFTAETLLPELQAMGYPIEMQLLKPAFYLTGGGTVEVKIRGAFKPRAYAKTEKPEGMTCDARILLQHIPETIAAREADVIRRELTDTGASFSPVSDTGSETEAEGPGNAVLIRVRASTGTTVFSEIGTPHLRAETVAGNAAKDAARFIRQKVPVSTFLADQLIVPLALAGGGTFLTTPRLSAHTKSCAGVLTAFTGKTIETNRTDDGLLVTVPAVL